jgi:hypothetical protein
MEKGSAMTQGILPDFGWGVELETDTEEELRLEREKEES